MSIFEFRKCPECAPARDELKTLRQTLERLEADPDETPGVLDLKRLLAARIAEMERKSA